MTPHRLNIADRTLEPHTGPLAVWHHKRDVEKLKQENARLQAQNERLIEQLKERGLRQVETDRRIHRLLGKLAVAQEQLNNVRAIVNGTVAEAARREGKAA